MFDNFDFYSSQYFIYDTSYNSATTKDFKEYHYKEDDKAAGGMTEEEKEQVTEAYEHAKIKGNPHDTVIEDIDGLRSELDSLRSDIEDAGIFDAANAITGVVGGGATVISTDEGKKLSLDVNTASAVDIRDGKITLEWEG